MFGDDGDNMKYVLMDPDCVVNLEGNFVTYLCSSMQQRNIVQLLSDMKND